MLNTLELSQTMIARLCHDLAGAIGNVNTSISLFDHSDKSITVQAQEIAEKESTNLVNRVKFFRSAYGIIDGEQEMSLVTISSLLSDFFKNSEIKLKIDLEEGLIYLKSQLAKAIMSLAAIASENINSIGSLNLHIRKNKNNPVRLLSNGYDLKLKDDRIDLLKGSIKHAINVRNCREYYIYKLCIDEGYKVDIEKKGGMVNYNLLKI